MKDMFANFSTGAARLIRLISFRVPRQQVLEAYTPLISMVLTAYLNHHFFASNVPSSPACHVVVVFQVVARVLIGQYCGIVDRMLAQGQIPIHKLWWLLICYYSTADAC